MTEKNDSDDLVTRIDVEGVATLTLNRPDKLNALSISMFEALRQRLDDVSSDELVECVVLTGAGRSFCAGHDLTDIAQGHRAPTPHFESLTVQALEDLPVPTVAKIRGHCLTGGLEVALACDILVASTNAIFGDTHGQWGLAPIWGMSVRLPERVGRSVAKELMFTSRRVDATRAGDIGLVDHVVNDDEIDEYVNKICQEIVANSKGTNRIVKALVADSGTLSRDVALTRERSLPYGLPNDMNERLAARTQRPLK